MSKNNTVAHKVIDDIVKLRTALTIDIGKFKTEVITAVQEINKAVVELQTKHNDMAAHLTAVEGIARNTAGFAASEIGKMGGTVHRHLHDLDRSVNAIDINVLALAELAKELVGQVTQIDVIISKLHSAIDTVFSRVPGGYNIDPPSKVTYGAIREDFRKSLELADSDVQELKTRAQKWYEDLVAAAFKTVRNRIDAEEAARKEKEIEEAQKAKESAEQLIADQTEAETIEDEMQKANSAELEVAVSVSGGDGSPFPDGAEIFGG